VSVAKFEHVHVDIVGPFPSSADGFSFVLTMIDRTTRWPEVAPLKTISAQECADTFTAVWVACFGVPMTVTTDRGTQFTSAVWACLCRTMNISVPQNLLFRHSLPMRNLGLILHAMLEK
jgi:cleavage and polyadenylation specificity factor subunit 1